MFMVTASAFVAASLFFQIPIFTGAQADQQAVSPVKTPNDWGEELVNEEDGWKEYSSSRGTLLRRELTIFPMAESAASEPVRLLPRDEEMRDANAAIWYLKALGFLEQTAGREAIERFHSEQDERMRQDADFQAAPWSWLEMPPVDLPLEEVKKYLSYSNFQRDLLHQAARCRNFDLDRNIHEIDDVAGFLLPEIQSLRQLGRDQSLRCRLAIAEDEFDTARTIIGQNLQLAHQLSDEPFLVSTLVGNAIAQSSVQDAIYLVGEPGSPNLYWAIAELPNPLVDQRRGVELETNMLLEQVRPLRKIGIVTLTTMEWSDFLTEVMPMMGDECNLVKRYKSAGMLGATLFIASAGDEVDSYLLNECGVTPEQLEALPATQAFFLAVRRMYEAAALEANHVYHAPASAQATMIRSNEKCWHQVSEQYPLLCNTIEWGIPRVARPVIQARWRLQQRLALLQTIEALRDHLANHDSQWPALSDLALPAPHDPVTGEPFLWSIDNEVATLAAAFNGVERLEFILEIGESQKPAPQAASRMPMPENSKSKWQFILQLDNNSLASSIFSDRVLDRLTPSERSVWQAVQQTVEIASQKRDGGTSEVFGELLPFLANSEKSSNDQNSDGDGILNAGLQSIADLPIRWVVALPQSFRQVIAETQPSISRDAHSDQSLSWVENVKWVAIGVDTERGLIKSLVQCEDRAAAMQVQDRLPQLAHALYKHLVDPAAEEVPSEGADLFVSTVTGDQVTFTAGGTQQNDDGLVSLIRLISAGFENSLARRVERNMTALLLAIHNYHAATNRLPPFAKDVDNTQRLGLSWRVYLLPFLGEGQLYEKFHMNEAWDSEHNLKLLPEIPDVYRGPVGAAVSDRDKGLTTLLAPTGKSLSFLGGKDEHAFRQVIDGLSNTVAVVEARSELAVPWTKPVDYEYDEKRPAAGLEVRGGKTVIGTGDGWAGGVPIDLSDEDWRSLFSIDGREQITEEFYRLRD